MDDATIQKFDEELVCAESIVYTLKHNPAVQQVNIGREIHDPPDFWLTVDGRKFAVEVTAIVKDQQYLARSRDFEIAVRRKANLYNKVDGTYIIYIHEPTTLPKKNSTEWYGLIDRAVENIHKKRHDGSKHSLYHDARKSLAIRQVHPNDSSIRAIISGGVKSEGEIQKELSILMQERIEKKRENLKKQEVEKKCKDIIIAFYDAYGFGFTKDAKTALQSVKGVDWFHSVFWAASFDDRANELWPTSPGRKGCFLHSREKQWIKTEPAN